MRKTRCFKRNLFLSFIFLWFLLVLSGLFLLAARPALAAWTAANPAVEPCSNEADFTLSDPGKIGIVGGQLQLKGYGSISGWELEESIPYINTQSYEFQDISMVNSASGWAVGLDYTSSVTRGTIWKYNGSWSLDSGFASPDRLYLYGVSMLSSTAGWAAGYQYDTSGNPYGRIYKYNGTTWTEEADTGATRTRFEDISMVDATTGWAVGRDETNSRGLIYRYNGTTWSADPGFTSLDNLYFYGVSMLNSNLGWAVGQNNNTGYATIWKYDGAGWIQEPITGFSGQFREIFMVDSSTGWAVGRDNSTGRGLIYRYDGAGWSTDPGFTSLDNLYFYGVSMVNANLGWAVGQKDWNYGTIWKYDAGIWSEAAGTGTTRGIFYGISALGSGSGWTAGRDNTHQRGIIWSGDGTWAENFNTGDGRRLSFYDTCLVDSNNIWAVGRDETNSRGTIWKYNGATWTEEINTEGTNLYFYGVSMLNSNLGWAVGFQYDASWNAYGKIYKYNGTTWTEEADTGATRARFEDISMVDASTGWAVGRDETNSRGLVYRYNGTTWSADPGFTSTDNIYFYGVSMLNSNLGWAVGRNDSTGRGLIYRYNGTTWIADTGFTSASNLYFYEVSMVNANLGWAVGRDNANSWGLIYKYNGTTWIADTGFTSAGNLCFYGVSMVNANLGWAVGTREWNYGIIWKYNGTSWSEEFATATHRYFRAINVLSDGSDGRVVSDGDWTSQSTGIYKAQTVSTYSTTAQTAETSSLASTSLTDFRSWRWLGINATGGDEGTLTAALQYRDIGASSWNTFSTTTEITSTGETRINISSVPINLSSGSEIKVVLTMASNTGAGRCFDIAEIKVGWAGPQVVNPSQTLCWTDSTKTTGIANNTWQAIDNTPYFEWEGATAPSGIAGYAVYWGQDASGDPGTTITQTTASYSVASAANGAWYLRLRTFDNDGDYTSAETAFIFRYAVGGMGASASSPEYTATSAFTVSWSGIDTSGGGPSSYDIQYRIDSGSWTNWKKNTAQTSAVFGGGSPVSLENGRRYWFRARIQNTSGGSSEYAAEGDCSTLADFKAPTVACSSPATSEETSFLVSWSATDGESGVDSDRGYDVQYRIGNGSWTDWFVNTLETSASFGPGSPVSVQPGQSYSFRIRAADKAGNLSSFSSPSATKVSASAGPGPSMRPGWIGVGNRPLRDGDYLDPEPKFTAVFSVSSDQTIDSTSIRIYINDTLISDGLNAGSFYDTFNSLTNFLTYQIKFPLADGTYSLALEAKTTDGQAVEKLSRENLKVSSSTRLALAEGSRPLSWPHPYKPSAGSLKITYILNRACPIQLKIYDRFGRVIFENTFFAGSNGAYAGYNEIFWDGKDIWGRQIENGIYGYALLSEQKLIGRGKIVVLE